MNHAIACLLLVLALAAGCTRENGAFCCIDAADCAAQGVDESRLCTDGLSCIDNQCVASMCATSGCAAATPVCEVATDTCVGCSDSTECMRFAITDVCEMASGACVECVSNIDCEAAKPVCEAMACRTCKLDSECPSAACADDGTCVPEANVVYLSPTGTDAAPCAKAHPCIDLVFAAQQVTNARSHIVFAAGTYNFPFARQLVANTTSLVIHGGGATLSGTADDGLIALTSPTVMRDLELVNSAGTALSMTSSVTIERVKARGLATAFATVWTSGAVTMRDVEISGAGCGLALNGGSLVIDRATIIGGTSGVCSFNPTVVNWVNLMVSGTSAVGANLTGVTGTISFMTITETGNAVTGVAGLSCTQAPLQIASSIIWTPAAISRPTVEGPCSVTSSIVGPTGVVGAMNVSPQFVSAATGDFHLSGGSPARDMANAGPTRDFEGDPRPRGARFDLGADEAP